MPYGLYSSDGGLRVTVVDEDESPYGIYSTDGSLRVTQDVGRGLYAPNGAIRVAYEDSAGAYTFTGALNGDLDTMNSIFYPNALGTGAPRVIDGDPFERVSIDGVLCERVSIDGVWATIDGQPVYMEV